MPKGARTTETSLNMVVLADETLERMCRSMSQQDAAQLRKYVADVEHRPRIWLQRVLEAIATELATSRAMISEGTGRARANGDDLAKVRGILESLPATIEAAIQLHEAKLEPIHNAAQRGLLAEARAAELANESAQLDIDYKRKKNEREHEGILETRALVIELVRRAPGWVVGAFATAIAGGASAREVAQYILTALQQQGAP